MDVSSDNSIVVSSEHVVFPNLVSSGQRFGSRNVVTAELQRPSSAINQPNASGSLRAVSGLEEVAAMGAEAAAEFLDIINSRQ